MRSFTIAAVLCTAAAVLAAPTVMAGGPPAAHSAKCTKKRSAKGKCSRTVARYVSEEAGVNISVTQKGDSRTVHILVPTTPVCRHPADPPGGGSVADGFVRGALHLSKKGKFSGKLKGTLDNGVVVSGTLHGKVKKSEASIKGRMKGKRVDPTGLNSLDCSGYLSESAARS